MIDIETAITWGYIGEAFKILLLIVIVWRLGKIIKLLSESRTVFTASQIPAEIPKGYASFTISTQAASVSLKGVATDNQFMRKEKKK